MSVTPETLDKLKVQMRAVKSLGTAVSSDLYTHLFEVFNRIMLHYQDDGYDQFEEISAATKYHNFKIEDPEADHEVNRNARAMPSIQVMINALDKLRSLLLENPEHIPDDDRNLVQEDLKCSIANYPDHALLLEQAGIGFGEERNLIIQKSLRRLAKVSGASKLKFFGKIFGTSCDYWIAQGVLNSQEENPANVQQEKRGDGVNSTVFWVTNSLVGDWIQLPDVQPEHLLAAQGIKKLLTGNLSAKVSSYPEFPGSEKNLLRAQLARI